MENSEAQSFNKSTAHAKCESAADTCNHEYEWKFKNIISEVFRIFLSYNIVVRNYRRWPFGE
jgi:hypothetical protein